MRSACTRQRSKTNQTCRAGAGTSGRRSHQNKAEGHQPGCSSATGADRSHGFASFGRLSPARRTPRPGASESCLPTPSEASSAAKLLHRICGASPPNPESRIQNRKAVGVGFEPTIEVIPDTGFQDRRLQPLGHPTGGVRRDSSAASDLRRRHRLSTTRRRCNARMKTPPAEPGADGLTHSSSPARKFARRRCRTGCCSLRMALLSTWRTRSRVTLKMRPTSSSV